MRRIDLCFFGPLKNRKLKGEECAHARYQQNRCVPLFIRFSLSLSLLFLSPCLLSIGNILLYLLRLSFCCSTVVVYDSYLIPTLLGVDACVQMISPLTRLKSSMLYIFWVLIPPHLKNFKLFSKTYFLFIRSMQFLLYNIFHKSCTFF